MTAQADITGLLPHAGNSLMIERVLRWDDREILVATARHRAADNPLRKAGRLASVHLAEFAAQAMAIHGGLCTRAAGREPQPALLVSVRDLVLARDFIDDLPGELEITARALLANPGSWQYEFTIRHGSEVIATGRVAAIAHVTAGKPPV
jgi:predicted hotdog family 3-hydroxylacyl-ACP dehydratase